MNNPDKICDNITDSIDELLTSVDAMRWTPSGDAATGATTTASTGAAGGATSGIEPADLKARFDALYETIDAFAGAVDDRLRTFADKVEGAFAEPAAPTTPAAPAPAHRAATDHGS